MNNYSVWQDKLFRHQKPNYWVSSRVSSSYFDENPPRGFQVNSKFKASSLEEAQEIFEAVRCL